MVVTPVRETYASDRPLVARIAAAVGGAAVVLGAVVALILAWWLGLVVTLAVGAGLWFGLITPRLASAEERTTRLIGPTRDLGDDVAELRFANLVEGLAPTAGIPRPHCLLVDDPAPNALAFGRTARTGYLVVTSGLVAHLSRMELEAVVAHCAVRLRAGAFAYATTAVAFGLRPRAADPAAADLAAVAVTRYPPGLIGALRVIGSAGPQVPTQVSETMAPLWLAPPGSDLTTRVETLEEL